jgi:hypothetical protein
MSAIYRWENLILNIYKNGQIKKSFFKANYRRHTGSNPSQAGDEQGLDARV